MPFSDVSRLRRPAINPRPLGGTDDKYTAIDKSKYCPRCSFSLYYMEEKDIWFCGKCAWNMPEEYWHKNQEEQQEQQEQQQQSSRIKGTAAAADDIKEENIVAVPMPDPQRNKKKDEFDYMRRDDAVYTERLGWTLVTDHIDFADDHKTVSSEDLKREKAKLREKTIR